MLTSKGEEDFTINKKGIAYAAFALGYEVLVCVLYGLYFTLHQDLTQQYQVGELYMVSALAILAVVGLGLMNSYITNSGFSGMALSLLTFALTIQHFFLMRAFWDKAEVHGTDSRGFEQTDYAKISWVNRGLDRSASSGLSHASVLDAIACAISMVIALTSLMGRIQPLEIFFLSLFGSFIYEVNSQILWRLFVTDIGYGMRIFLFGSVMGLVSSLILGRRETTQSHPHYKSVYSSRAYGILGLIIVFCAFPLLATSGVYQVSTNFDYVTFMVPFNMWFALGSGILGCFSISALVYRKIHLYEVVYSGLSGGVAYSSCSVLHRNPAVPLTVGFIVGIMSCLFHSKLIRRCNNKGVMMSLGVYNPYIMPGIMAGMISSILYSVDQTTISQYDGNQVRQQTRTAGEQGTFQLAGIAISLALGLGAGLVIGLIFKICNRHSIDQQFNDNAIFSIDKPNATKYKDMQEQGQSN